MNDMTGSEIGKEVAELFAAILTPLADELEKAQAELSIVTAERDALQAEVRELKSKVHNPLGVNWCKRAADRAERVCELLVKCAGLEKELHAARQLAGQFDLLRMEEKERANKAEARLAARDAADGELAEMLERTARKAKEMTAAQESEEAALCR